MGVRIERPAAAGYYLSDRLAEQRLYDGPVWARWDRDGGLPWLQAGAEVMAVDFHAAMAAQPPGKAPLTTRRRRVAYDITVDCDKAISAQWALGADRERVALEMLHDRAVSAVFTEIERIGMVARRGAGGHALEPVPMPATATFLHLTSRPAPMPSGRMLPGPHLHSQILVMNLARRADGSWGAIEGGRLYRALPHLKIVQRRILDAGLRELGLSAHRDETGRLHIEGIDPCVVRGFSPRNSALRRATQHIRDERAAAVARRRLAVWDRAPKSELPLAALWAAWSEEARIALATGVENENLDPRAGHFEDNPGLAPFNDSLRPEDVAGEPLGPDAPERPEEDPYVLEELAFEESREDDVFDHSESEDISDDEWTEEIAPDSSYGA